MKIFLTYGRKQTSRSRKTRELQMRKTRRERHIIIKLSEVKENIKSKKERNSKQANKNCTYKGSSISLSADFQEETLQAERE